MLDRHTDIRAHLIGDMSPRKILDFVLARRHETGGFGAAPTLPPSVEDTYYALRILELLPARQGDDAVRTLMRDPALVQFLLHLGEKDEWQAKTGYHYVYCCRLAGIDPGGNWIRRFASDRMRDSTGLADHFYCVRILQKFEQGPFSSSVSLQWRSARELWMALVLADGRPENLPAEKDDLITWIRSCQNPDGGFGFLPATTSYMENVHTCLRVLALLGTAPLDPARAGQFILNARTRSGGFARKSGGAPFLDATWHAVGSLSILVL